MKRPEGEPPPKKVFTGVQAREMANVVHTDDDDLKFYDQAGALSLQTTGPAPTWDVVSFPLVSQGTGFEDRIGRRVQLKTLRFRGALTIDPQFVYPVKPAFSPVFNAGMHARLVVGWTNYGGDLAQLGQLISNQLIQSAPSNALPADNTGYYLGGLSKDQTKRLIILRDEMFAIPVIDLCIPDFPVWNPNGTPPTMQLERLSFNVFGYVRDKVFDFEIDLDGLFSTYSLSTAGGQASESAGLLFAALVGNAQDDAPRYAVDYCARTYFWNADV